MIDLDERLKGNEWLDLLKQQAKAWVSAVVLSLCVDIEEVWAALPTKEIISPEVGAAFWLMTENVDWGTIGTADLLKGVAYFVLLKAVLVWMKETSVSPLIETFDATKMMMSDCTFTDFFGCTIEDCHYCIWETVWGCNFHACCSSVCHEFWDHSLAVFKTAEWENDWGMTGAAFLKAFGTALLGTVVWEMLENAFRIRSELLLPVAFHLTERTVENTRHCLPIMIEFFMKTALFMMFVKGSFTFDRAVFPLIMGAGTVTPVLFIAKKAACLLIMVTTLLICEVAFLMKCWAEMTTNFMTNGTVLLVKLMTAVASLGVTTWVIYGAVLFVLTPSIMWTFGVAIIGIPTAVFLMMLVAVWLMSWATFSIVMRTECPLMIVAWITSLMVYTITYLLTLEIVMLLMMWTTSLASFGTVFAKEEAVTVVLSVMTALVFWTVMAAFVMAFGAAFLIPLRALHMLIFLTAFDAPDNTPLEPSRTTFSINLGSVLTPIMEDRMAMTFGQCMMTKRRTVGMNLQAVLESLRTALDKRTEFACKERAAKGIIPIMYKTAFYGGV